MFGRKKIDWPELGRTLVAIDAANLEKSAQSLKTKVHYSRLRRFLRENEKLVEIRYYTAAFGTKKHDDFLMSLKRKGYILVTKPLKIISNMPGEPYVRKANFDVEITYDVRDVIHLFDTLILFSGDSDFNYLIQKVKRMGKKVLIFSTRYHVSKELIHSCTRYYDIKKFRQEFLK